MARLESSRQAAVADRQLTVDVMVFSSWLEMKTEGNQPLAAQRGDVRGGHLDRVHLPFSVGF